MINSRKAHFTQGATSVPGETASLMQSGQQFNMKDPNKFSPNGLNQQLLPSANGMSAKDASRQTPNGLLPSQNGMSASTYSKLIPQYGMSLNI